MMDVREHRKAAERISRENQQRESGSVAADLPVSFQLVGAFEQVISLENSVHSVFLTHLRHGSLQPSFFRQCAVIGKKIQLETAVIKGHFVCADAEPPVQQMVTAPTTA